MDEQKTADNNLINLIREFFRDFFSLISEHIKLLKLELTENTHRVVKALISLMVALVMGYVGLIFFGFLLVIVLSMFIPLWMALMLVTAVYFGIPLALLVYALNLLHSVFNQPKQSIQELEKTGEEAKIWLRNLKK